MVDPDASSVLTRWSLGILAGGRATRLNGFDKSQIRIDDVAQVVRLADSLGVDASRVLFNGRVDSVVPPGVSLIADAPSWYALNAGPFAGLSSLVDACTSPLLLTVPVDLLQWPADLYALLSDALCDHYVATLRDASGLQPLVSLWRVDALRAALSQQLALGNYAVRDLLASNRVVVDVANFDCGNLNTFADLALAGAVL